jgi:hypothetical protein
METRIEDAFRAGNLTIRLVQGRNVKLFIFRNDRSELPHLTISWRNPSKEIDIHFKKRTKGGREHHDPIAIILESDFSKAYESFQVALLKVMALNIDELGKIKHFGCVMKAQPILLLAIGGIFLSSLWVLPVPLLFIIYTSLVGIIWSVLFIIQWTRKSVIASFINFIVLLWGSQLARDASLPEAYVKQHRGMLLLQSLCIILAISSIFILLFRSRIKKELFPNQ